MQRNRPVGYRKARRALRLSEYLRRRRDERDPACSGNSGPSQENFPPIQTPSSPPTSPHPRRIHTEERDRAEQSRKRRVAPGPEIRATFTSPVKRGGVSVAPAPRRLESVVVKVPRPSSSESEGARGVKKGDLQCRSGAETPQSSETSSTDSLEEYWRQAEQEIQVTKGLLDSTGESSEDNTEQGRYTPELPQRPEVLPAVIASSAQSSPSSRLSPWSRAIYGSLQLAHRIACQSGRPPRLPLWQDYALPIQGPAREIPLRVEYRRSGSRPGVFIDTSPALPRSPGAPPRFPTSPPVSPGAKQRQPPPPFQPPDRFGYLTEAPGTGCGSYPPTGTICTTCHPSTRASSIPQRH